jgi:hypothetical protein
MDEGYLKGSCIHVCLPWLLPGVLHAVKEIVHQRDGRDEDGTEDFYQTADYEYSADTVFTKRI